jgi:hypothetical protein
VIDDIANSVRSTGAWISANGVDARPFRCTIVVLGAFDLEDRLGSTACAAAAANVTARTHAYHSAYLMRRQDSAFGRLRARLYNRTRVLAPVIEAGE